MLPFFYTANDCIANLKSRTDKQAQDLYKNFKLKMGENVEGNRKTSIIKRIKS